MGTKQQRRRASVQGGQDVVQNVSLMDGNFHTVLLQGDTGWILPPRGDDVGWCCPEKETPQGSWMRKTLNRHNMAIENTHNVCFGTYYSQQRIGTRN
eukprot:5356097-Pyramimonas_sp.AAC.1